MGALTLCLLAIAPATGQSAPTVAPAPGPGQYREVRPPAGTGRRGLVPVPAWVVWAAAGVGVAGTLAYLARTGLSRRDEDA